MIISRCYLTFYAPSGSSIKSQVLDFKTLPIFSPLKISVNLILGFARICGVLAELKPEGVINTYSMTIYVLLHFEQKVTSQSLPNFCTELRATASSSVKFDSDYDIIFVFKM